MAGGQSDNDKRYGARFRQKFTLEDAIGSHACSLEANTRVTNGIPLGSSLLLPVHTVNCVQTLEATAVEQWRVQHGGSIVLVDKSTCGRTVLVCFVLLRGG
jgi:hypothetical protein